MVFISQRPDTTACPHSSWGIEGEVRKVDNFEIGYCPDCKREISFRLDGSGRRIGEKCVVETEKREPDDSDGRL